MIFLSLLVVPALLALALFVFFSGFSWRELGAQVIVQLAIVGAFAAIVSCVKTSDVEVWNGRIASKERLEVGCRHGYQCMCVPVCTGSGTSQVCTTICQTCYEHSFDVDWRLVTSNGELILVDPVDRQGISQPPRWASARVGEATAVLHDYENFVKAVPDAVFRPRPGAMRKYAGMIPEYPLAVYDYHRIDRLVLVGGARVADPRAWNDAIDAVAADVGAARQANVVIVIAAMPRDFFLALEEAWVGGKKNDVILVVGLEGSGGRAAWVDAMAWTIRPEFKEKLRADVLALPRVDDPRAVLDVVRRDVMELHQRKPMHDFAYLKSAIVPSLWQWVAAAIVSLLAGGTLAFVFHSRDPLGDDDRRIRRRRREAAADDDALRRENERLGERIKDLQAQVPTSDYRTVGRRP